MPAAWTERRLFLSSTFRDFHAERDHLHEVVFPALQERLAARRCTLVPVDLRWGVETGAESQGDAKDLLVLRVCLGEIERCKPFVLALIGDRYGWVPPAARMTAAAREAGFDADVADKSVTALEVEVGLLALAATAQCGFAYLREPLPYEAMPPALAATYSEAHVGDAGGADRQTRLQRLKQRVRTEMPERTRTYRAQWDPIAQHVAGLEAWGQQVLDDLWSVLDADTVAAVEAAPSTWQDHERAAVDEFVAHRGRLVVGRDALVDAMVDCATSPVLVGAPWATAVVADPGAGKSAVFASLWMRLQARPDLLVLAHVAGISSRAGSVDAMLRRFCQELAAASERPDPCSEGMSFDTVQAMFGEWVTRAAEHLRVVILLDALNEFEDSPTANQLTWLPDRIHGNVRLIATSLRCPAVGALLKRDGVERLDLPALGQSDARVIVAAVCARHRKKLPAAALEALLRRTRADGQLAAGWPLWLALAIDELLLLDEDDFARATSFSGTPEQQLQALLTEEAERMPADIAGLYGALFDRAEAVHGVQQARALTELLATSRNGLRESDLGALIPARTTAPWDPLRFANLRRGLRAHVVSRGQPLRWDFVHAQAREAVRRRGLADAEYAKGLHAALAAHFGDLPADDPLRCSERMVHLVGCDDVAGAVAAIAAASKAERTAAAGVVAARMASAVAADAVGQLWTRRMLGHATGTAHEHAIYKWVTGRLWTATAQNCTVAARFALATDSLEAARSAANSRPLDKEAAEALGWSLDCVFAIHLQKEELPQARRIVEEGTGLALRAVAADADDPDALEDQVIWLQRDGRLAMQEGDEEQGLAAFLKAQHVVDQLAALGHFEADDRSRYCNRTLIADLLLRRSQFAEAKAMFEASLVDARDLLAKGCDEPEVQRDVFVALRGLGDVASYAGDHQLARELLSEACAIAASRLAESPFERERVRDHAVILRRLAGCLVQTNDVAQGVELARLCVQALVEHCVRDPGDRELATDLVDARCTLANALCLCGCDVEGEAEAGRALEHADTLRGWGVGPVGSLALAGTLYTLAMAASSRNDFETAETHCRLAIERATVAAKHLKTNIRARQTLAAIVDWRALAAVGLGRYEAALRYNALARRYWRATHRQFPALLKARLEPLEASCTLAARLADEGQTQPARHCLALALREFKALPPGLRDATLAENLVIAADSIANKLAETASHQLALGWLKRANDAVSLATDEGSEAVTVPAVRALAAFHLVDHQLQAGKAKAAWRTCRATMAAPPDFEPMDAARRGYLALRWALVHVAAGATRLRLQDAPGATLHLQEAIRYFDHPDSSNFLSVEFILQRFSAEGSLLTALFFSLDLQGVVAQFRTMLAAFERFAGSLDSELANAVASDIVDGYSLLADALNSEGESALAAALEQEALVLLERIVPDGP